MIKVGFCDDDLKVLNEIRGLVNAYQVERNQEITYIAFQSPVELLAEIEKGRQMDILFLDIIMPGENGINVAKEIRKYDSNVKIIFLSSSSEFGVQSYTVNAYFYQLKPICKEGFFRLMDSVLSECKQEEQNSLVLRCKSGIIKIDINKIIYCEVIGRIVLFHLEGGQILERVGSLDELWGKLMQYENFLRPHRSFLINMEYIQNISCKAIVMINAAEIPVPHGKYSNIKNRYLEYAFNRKQVFLS